MKKTDKNKGVWMQALNWGQKEENVQVSREKKSTRDQHLPVGWRCSWCHSSRYLAIKHSWCLQNTETAFHLILQHLLSAAGTPRKRPCKVQPKRLQCEPEKSQLGESKTEQHEPTDTHLTEMSFFFFSSGMAMCLHHRSTLQGKLPWPRSSKKH